MYRRRRGFLKRSKYSNETVVLSGSVQIAGGENKVFPVYNVEGQTKTGTVLVAPADLQGTRKVKNMLLTINSSGNSQPIVGCVVYLPAGTSPSSIETGASYLAGSMYEPNQNVIMQFVLPPNLNNSIDNVLRVKTRLARNLDSGDKLLLVCKYIGVNSRSDTDNVNIAGTFNYAVSY